VKGPHDKPLHGVVVPGSGFPGAHILIGSHRYSTLSVLATKAVRGLDST